MVNLKGVKLLVRPINVEEKTTEGDEDVARFSSQLDTIPVNTPPFLSYILSPCPSSNL
jgi:hypothetical protein